MVLPYRGRKRTDGGIELTEETLDRQRLGTVLGYVLKVGKLAYRGDRFFTGPWCEVGDWVLFGRYAGSRFQIEGGEIKILNDDETLIFQTPKCCSKNGIISTSKKIYCAVGWVVVH
jgi:co-chaperonin GroES (HSP10)